MFTPRQALLSAILCAALTSPIQASAPDEGTSTNSNTPTWDIETSNAAKVENANHPLMSLNRGTLTEVCRFLADNDAADTIANLGMSSIHMAGRILKPVGEYAELFNDPDMRINNPDMRQAIRIELRKAIDARAEELATRQKALETQSEDQPKPEPKAPLLAPWKELLGENASLNHLIWAQQMLQHENVKRLRQNGLLEQLAAMEDKQKALCLAAHATECFTEEMGRTTQAQIIEALLSSSRPVSEIVARCCACKEHLFTEMMDGIDQAILMRAALASSRPLSDYAAHAATCKKSLFMEGMNGWYQAAIISYVLPLSNTQIDQLVRECAARSIEESFGRMSFITVRVAQLRVGK